MFNIKTINLSELKTFYIPTLDKKKINNNNHYEILNRKYY